MSKNKSFTIIELLITIVIIGILAGIIIVSTASSIDKANIAKSKVFSEGIRNSLILGLVSEWKFDGPTPALSPATSEDVKDSWGTNNGIISGNVIVRGESDCVSKKCLDLNGAAVSFGNDDSLKKITQELTISYWVYINEAPPQNYAFIVSKGFAPLVNGSFTAGLTTSRAGYFFIRKENNADYSAPPWTAIPLKKWIFHTHVFKGNDFLATYRDGLILIDSIRNNIEFLKIYESTNNVQIGGGEKAERNFKGLIDEVQIYNMALPLSQIKQNYIAGLDSLLSKNLISSEEYRERIQNLSNK